MSLARSSRLAIGRMRDWEKLAHMLSERVAKAFGVGRHRAPPVPLNGVSLAHRLALVSHAHDPQYVAIGPQHRRNDRDPLPRLREREQGVGRAALEPNIGLDI